MIETFKKYGFVIKDIGNNNYVADYKDTVSLLFVIGDNGKLTGAVFWKQMLEGRVLRSCNLKLNYTTISAINLFGRWAIFTYSNISKNRLFEVIKNIREVARTKLTKSGEYRFANGRLYNRNSTIGNLVSWIRQYNQVSDTMDIEYHYKDWYIHNFGKGYHVVDPDAEYHGIKDSLEKALSYIDKEERK